jgi:hypothetical protein
MKHIDVDAFVLENKEWYVSLARSYLYYQSNYIKYLHRYSAERLHTVAGRDAVNLGRLLKIVDFYCDSQAEFDRWIDVINRAMEDYIEMLDIPSHFNKLVGKSHSKDEQLDEKEQNQIEQYKKQLRKFNTSREKVEQIKKWSRGDTPEQIKDQQVWGFDKEIL